MQLPHESLFLFYEGTDPQFYTKLNSVNLNAAAKQLLANDEAIVSELDSHNHNNLYYTKAESDAAFNSLIDNAPAALNSFNELAQAINDNPNFATDITAALNSKVNNSRVLTDVPANALFTDTIYSHPATHSISEVSGLQSALLGKLGSYEKAADSTLFDGEGINNFLRTKSDLDTEDLDNVTDVGIYRQLSGGKATKGRHYPAEGESGVLEVYSINHQRYTSISGTIWSRRFDSTFWSLWETQYFSLESLGYTGDNDANKYVHPALAGQSLLLDTGSLTGARVISSLQLTLTSNSEGHITLADSNVSTRLLTLASLGYTGALDANKYVHPATHSMSEISGLQTAFDFKLNVGDSAADSNRLGGQLPSAYLLSTGKAADSDKLDGNNTSSGDTPNSIPVRDPSGDITARTFRSTFAGQSTAPAGTATIAFRNNNGSDNYLRYLTHSALLDYIGQVPDSESLQGYSPSANDNANTVALRDNQGDLKARTLETTIGQDTTSISEVAFRRNGTSDNILRFVPLASFKQALGKVSDSALFDGNNVAYFAKATDIQGFQNSLNLKLNTTGVAADSSKLGGVDASEYLTSADVGLDDYLLKTGKAADSNLLDSYAASSQPLANTVALRDSNGALKCLSLLSPELHTSVTTQTSTPISTAQFAFRNDETDNLVRFCGKAHLLSFLGKVSDSDKLDGNDSTYFATASALTSGLAGKLGTTAKAADSDKLDGNDSTYFATASALNLKLNVGDSAADSDRLGGQLPSAYLLANAKAADSNLLDGVDSASFVRKDQNSTITASNLILSSSTVLGIGDASPLTLRHQGAVAAITNQVGNFNINNLQASSYLIFNGVGGSLGSSAMIKASVDEGVILSHSASEKLSTLSDGVRVDGELYITGNWHSSYSDKRLKKITGNLDTKEALSSVNKWNPVRYIPNEKARDLGIGSDQVEIGLLVQDVEVSYPELTSIAALDRGKDGTSITGENYKSLSYERVIPVHTAAIQELTNLITEMKFKMDAMQVELDSLKAK